MATASDLIKGEALVAQSGNINYGEEIGKGLETIGKSIAEAKSTISNWSDKESAFNDSMANIDADDTLSNENKAIAEFVTAQKARYAEAAKKASRIPNRSSKEYKELVEIMNDVNASFKTLAKEKQNLLDERQFNIENPNIYSSTNNLYEKANKYLNFVSSKEKNSFGVDPEGHLIMGDTKWIDLSRPAGKSPFNAAMNKVLVSTYDKVKKDGKELTDNELENAANGLVASIMGTGNHLLTTQQLLLDPIYGEISLATEEEVKGKNKEELIVLAKDRYKGLLREQSNRGKNDYAAPEKPGSKYTNFYRTDGLIKSMSDWIAGRGAGTNKVIDRNLVYQVEKGEGKTEEERKRNSKIYLLKSDGTKGEDPTFVKLYREDAAGVLVLNKLDFRALTGDTTPKQMYK